MSHNYLFWLLIGLISAIAFALQASLRASREKAAKIKSENEVKRLINENVELHRKHDGELYLKDCELKRLTEHMREVNTVVEERKIQFPWLASAIADLHALDAERDANLLATKTHPAVKAADVVRDHGSKRREAERQFRILRYRSEYYEKLFPWITEFVGNDVPDEAVNLSGLQSDTTDDPAKRWVSEAEYQKLSSTQRNQLALERWKGSRRTLWEIGRDYERFVGYHYELLGFDVTYTGAIHGFEDMGRDLIARRGSALASTMPIPALWL